MTDFVKEILKALGRGLFAVMIPIGMVIGGAALIGFAVENDWTILVWIGSGMLVAGLIWGALLYLLHG